MPSTASAARSTGEPDIVFADHIDKRDLRFMGDGAAYAYHRHAAGGRRQRAEEARVSNERTGLIAGSGGPSTTNLFEAHRT